MKNVLSIIIPLVVLSILLAGEASAQIYYGSEYYELGYPAFMVSYLFFKEDSLVRTEVYVQTNNEHLQFLKRKYYFIALYELQIALLSENNLVMKYDSQDSLVVPNYGSTRSSSPVSLKPVVFLTKPGDYTITTRFTDKDSKKSRRMNEKIKIPKFGIEEYVSSVKFLKSSDSKSKPLEPVISKRYLAHDTTLYLYYEIYPPDELDSLELRYQIISKENEILFLDSLRVYNNRKIENKIPLNNLGPGEFDLVINLHADTFSVEKRDNFSVMWSPIFQIKDDFSDIIGQLQYIASDSWITKLEEAPDSIRVELWKEFWKEKDPTPETDRNEVKDEFYRRIAYTNRHFTGFNKGWETDRGKIYIIYGHPDEIENHPFDANSKPYEIWYYFQINKKFIFVDKNGTNEYHLYYEE